MVAEFGVAHRAGGQGGCVHFQRQLTALAVEGDHVAVAHAGNRAVGQRLGAEVDGGGHLARCARHAPVCHQRHLEAFVLQHGQRGREFVQFGHAVGAWPLVAHHGNEVALQLPGVEQGQQVLLVAHHHGGGAHHPVLGLDGRHLDDAAAQVALQQAQAAIGAERVAHGAQHGGIGAGGGHRPPGQNGAIGAVVQPRLLGVGVQALARYGGHIGMQQTGSQQLLHQKAHATGCVEMVHIGAAVGVHAGQQRHHGGEFGKVVPVDQHPGGAGHCNQVDGVVGAAAGGQQAHQSVDQGLLGHDVGQADGGRAGFAGVENGHAHGFAGEGFAQRGAGVDEGRAGQVQAHDFHQHLVAVGRAVEGAGAGAVVGLGFAFQQGIAAHQALGVLLAHLGLGIVGQAAGHGACGHEHGAQVAELHRAHEQAGHDLVAHAQHQRGIEHVVRQRHGGGQGNHIAREQRQLHARFALGDAVAHGGHATGHLGRGTQIAGMLAQQLGVGLIRLVGREHVVVGGDDAHMRCAFGMDAQLVGHGQGSGGVGHVGAAQPGTLGAPAGVEGLGVQVGSTGGRTALGDAPGDGGQRGVDGRGRGGRCG